MFLNFPSLCLSVAIIHYPEDVNPQKYSFLVASDCCYRNKLFFGGGLIQLWCRIEDLQDVCVTESDPDCVCWW